MSRRIRWLGVVILLCFAVVMVQLTHIQFGEAKKLADSSSNPKNATLKYNNDRGYILAADGTVLARSVRTPAGVSSYKYYRQYPGGALYSGIVGYSSTYYGTAGVESAYNDQLVPHTQPAQSLSQLLNPPPKTTDTVSLTVQPYLQQVAAQALQQYSDQYKDGAVVALNPRTGAVEAMYSNPNFDPNALADPNVNNEIKAGTADFHTKDGEGFYPGDPMATFDTFAPGSTFKVVTSAAVYNLDPSLDNFTINFPTGCTDKGQIPNTDKVVCNDSNNPPGNPCGGTLTEMLPQSCDPGYAMLGISVGATNLAQQANLFGWNKRPPIDLDPREVSASFFPPASDLEPPNQPILAYSAFGQENVTATTLQNAMVAEGIADNGVVMTPHVMAQVRDSQGRLVQTYQPTKYLQATSALAAEQTNTLMQGVVTSPEGTANGVFSPSLDVAAKTGTAQTFVPGTNSAVPATNDWMIAFAPANNPKIAVAVVVPYQSQTFDTGAAVAGPIVNAVITAALSHQ